MSHISKELISKAAEFFRVVGDETRMKILCTIAGGELCVNDIAAEVAKLAMQIEGPNSTIEAMLAAEPVSAKPANANGAPAPAAAGAQGGTLADRIRALQSHASRARQIGA